MKLKSVLTLALSLVFVLAIAQERVPGPSKTMEQIQNKCITVTGADGTTVTINDIVESILGEGVAYSNVTYQGVLGNAAQASIGFFSGGDCVPLGFNDGIILSSGTVGNAVGPNTSASTTATLGLPGDPDLNALIPGFQTFDASWIQFDFIPEDSQIFIQYVFASEEYNQYVGSSYNDVFGFFVNGQNIALIPGTTTPVAINNVNNGYAPSGQFATGPCTNCEFYRDNGYLPEPPYNIEADGLTVVLTATANVTPGETNTIKIAVADAGDTVLDSWVFVKAESFSTIPPDDDPIPPDVPLGNWAIFIGLGLIVIFMVVRFRRLV
jgi:hypothetical protein